MGIWSYIKPGSCGFTYREDKVYGCRYLPENVSVKDLVEHILMVCECQIIRQMMSRENTNFGVGSNGVS